MIRRIFLATLILALLAGACRAGEGGQSGWSEWRHMPVFGEGRVAPLDTFARETVEAICGTADPTLWVPDQGTRKFTAGELLFAWLAAPEKWEQTPFIAVPDEQLREDILQSREGSGTQYVSPAQVEKSEELSRRWAELEKRAEAEGKGFRLTGIDKKIKAVVDACNKFRLLTFRPALQQEPPERFYARLRLAANAWRKLAGDLQGAQRISGDEEVRRLMVASSEALQQLLKQMHDGQFVPGKVEPSVVAFLTASGQLTARLTDATDKPLTALAAELRHQAAEMHMALYDNGETLYLVPSLSVGALEMNREPSDDAKPWLSFQALIYGSPELLRQYPQAELQEARKAWESAKASHDARGAADAATDVGRFVAAVRILGAQIEPLREKLPIRHRDQQLIDATAYPPLGATDMEVFYNRLDPFFWSWVVSLTATLCLLFAVGRLQKRLFWLGVSVLAAAQVLTVVGLGLRGYVTGLVPLTGMFETVVFVALSVAILGLWFTLLPLFWPGLQAAWRMNGIGRGRGSATGLRVGLTVFVFVGLTRLFGWFGLRVFDLWPPTALGTTVPSANDIFIWLAGLCVLGALVYFVPRAVAALLVGVVTMPTMLAHRQGDVMEQTFGRRLFVLAGAIVSFVAMVLAYYAPSSVMHRNIGSVTPILRDNYWLAVHVVTIMASYASAAIALILGNIALGYYLFGRYTTERRPPRACTVLAGFTYTAIQITVLLLTAGTVLGALWADKSWGRFWGWDPKEAWAMISLLVYLIILHARYVGWAGNFGMALAAVFGFTAVLFTWYFVNFFWGTGMHSYGSGAGGQWATISALLRDQWKMIAPIAINWLFLAAAAVRYWSETGWGEVEMKDEG